MYRLVFLGVASLACSLSSTSHAEMDEGCFQRMLGQRDERLQLCRDKFEGEHRDLCETAAKRVHERNVKICTSERRVAERRLVRLVNQPLIALDITQALEDAGAKGNVDEHSKRGSIARGG